VTRRRAVAAGLAALSFAVAGCGGTSKEDYQQEIDEVVQQRDDQFTEIARNIQASGSLESAAADIEKGAEALDDAAADLEDIEPPDDAEDAHQKIVDGFDTLAEDFRAAAQAASANDARRVLDLFGNFEASAGFRKIEQARKELRDAGYDVEG
jgi:hypothetical protein